ncbi:hypothetical protein GYMLUDRAFT_67534 [Collybiopsis luxurians FD-317 M1]|nr:hypothetical protein GYMLUDRAFT_67534 [Collybiopsis luxurians FD-317 M1]
MQNPLTAPQTPNRPEVVALFSSIDIQDHSTPHMKTRVAVRDGNPHRFQVLPLKEVKETSPAIQPFKKGTPLSNVRKGLRDITNTSLVVSGKFAYFESESENEFSVKSNKSKPQVDLAPISPVRPLNIIKRGPQLPSGSEDSPRFRSSVIKKPGMTGSYTPPAFDFLNSPADARPAMSKHRRHSRSSNLTFMSKLPMSSARARARSDQSKIGEFPEHHHSKFSSVSTPSTPTLSNQRILPTATGTKTLTLVSKDAVRADAITTSTTNTIKDIPLSSKSSKISSRFVSRIPSSFKSKSPYQSRTCDPALLKSRHGIAHSVDILNLNAETPRQDVRTVFSNGSPRDAAVDVVKTRETNATPTPALPLRLRGIIRSETPSKRHAIYTRSLYVEKSPVNCRTPKRVAPLLKHTLTEVIAQSEGAPTSFSSSDSLESIMQVYQDREKDVDDHSHSFSMSLPTSLSEPTLHDISKTCADVPSETKAPGTSVSLTSLSSVYSQDSWISGKRQSDTQITHSNLIFGYHPIVWELLRKLESEEKAWLWDN